MMGTKVYERSRLVLVTKWMMPRHARASVESRIAEVQEGSWRSANGSCRKIAATWGKRCADCFRISHLPPKT